MSDDGRDRVFNAYGAFTMVPNEIVLGDLSDRAKVLYMHLVQISNSGGLLRSRKFLAERLSKSVDTLDRAVRELVEFGALEVIAHRRDDGSADWNEYRLIIIRRPAKQGGVAADLRPGGSRKNAARGSRKNAAPDIDLAESKKPPLPPRGDGDVSTTISTADPAPPVSALFEQFWSVYPLPEGRIGAEREWHRALAHASPSAIIAAAVAYAEHLRRAGKTDFAMKPVRWLRDGEYLNHPAQAAAAASPYRKLPQEGRP